MNNYSKLREIIIKANPSILDLKFGCKGIYEKEEIVVYYCDYHWVKYIHLNNLHCQYQIGKSYLLEKAKIIGRDITLEDVLIALRKKADKKFLEVSIDISGEFSDMDNAPEELIGTCKRWIFGKPLKDQSKDTQDYLLEVLKD